jgi:hypothetical protein
MLGLVIFLLLITESDSHSLRDSGASDKPPFVPHHVRIQHIDVTTHSDIVIDTHTPHFSWQLANEYTDDGHLVRGVQQVGYHILVHEVVRGQMMWNSDYVHSSLSTHIRYTGSPFTSDTRYTITIQYFTTQGQSEWYTAHFRTALFSLTDWSGE